jgi:AcrR family transcriptional regulator
MAEAAAHDGVDRKLTARGEERRRQIVDVATRLFAERGYHPTSVAEVVDAVGVGKGVFYWYFASKEALFTEILRQGQLSRRRHQRDAIAGIEDPVEQLERGIRAGMEWMAEHRDVITLIRFAATEERFAAGIRKGEDVAAADASLALRRAMDEGRIPDGDLDLLARAVVGVTQHLCATRIHSAPDADPKPVIDAAVSFCIGGVLGTTTRAGR